MNFIQQHKEIVEFIASIITIILFVFGIFEIIFRFIKKISILKWLIERFQKIITTISGSNKKNAVLKEEINKLQEQNELIKKEFENYKNDITQLKNKLEEQEKHCSERAKSLENRIKEGLDKVEENKTPNVLHESKKEKDFYDHRSGRLYKVIKIGEQIWLAEDLDYMPNSTSRYVERPKNTYDWEMAMKVALVGWHLPSEEEWLELIDFAGGRANAGRKLKAKEGWFVGSARNCNGTDDFGFATLPYGRIDNRDDCSWWSSSERGSKAFFVTVKSDDSIETGHEQKSCQKFVRYIKD